MWNEKKKAEALSSLMNDGIGCQCCGSRPTDEELTTGCFQYNWNTTRYCPDCQVKYLDVDPNDKRTLQQFLEDLDLLQKEKEEMLKSTLVMREERRIIMRKANKKA